jgi:DNA-binding GntR family transcriptional regulator
MARKTATLGRDHGKVQREEMKSPIDKETYRTKVYAYLRERIIAGELLPGEMITLHGLSHELGVSIAPVREALVQLESEKVILRRDNRDYRVNTLSLAQFDEIFRIRRMLEPYLGDRGCRRRPDSAVAEAGRILKAMRDACSDAKRFVSLNHALHFFFYSFAERPILLEIANQLWARIGPYLTITLRNQDLKKNLDVHVSLLDSFTRKDPKGFNRMLLADMKFSHGYVAPLIRSQEAGQSLLDPAALG